jgi:hypothetical protein
MALLLPSHQFRYRKLYSHVAQGHDSILLSVQDVKTYGAQVKRDEKQGEGEASDTLSSQSHGSPRTFRCMSDPILGNIYDGVNRARRYFPGPRPIGSQHDVTPWPIFVHACSTRAYPSLSIEHFMQKCTNILLKCYFSPIRSIRGRVSKYVTNGYKT